MHNITFRHQNAEASKPLTIPMQVVCNTEEDKILSNVLTNSRKIKRWVKTVAEHDGIAVVCGSSPSIADYVENIRNHQENGAKVFALNGAARFLTENNIRADYQIIMDAQPRTIDLIGDAEQYLFASQVDPALFDKVRSAILWHSTHGNTLVDAQDGFPKHDDEYCLIGSSATVGNTSLALLYAMGYRKFKIYGMDSSHRGDSSHVAHQSINDGDPCLMTNFNGKDYLCSFTMKMQADTFMQRARALEQAGCTFEVFGDGLLPAMWNTPVVITGEHRN